MNAIPNPEYEKANADIVFCIEDMRIVRVGPGPDFTYKHNTNQTVAPMDKTSEVKMFVRTFTPEDAVQILESKNRHNRPLKEWHVKRLANEMTRGRWKMNGDTICMDRNGEVLDGQHRLAAVVMSGVTITSHCVTGLDPDVFTSKDVGMRRSGGDVLAIAGERNTTRLCGALTIINSYKSRTVDNSKVCKSKGEDALNNEDIVRLLEKYPNVRDSLHPGVRCRFLSGSILDACHYLFAEKDRNMADEFIDKVVNGEDLSKDDPFLVLRNRLIENKSSQYKLSRTSIFCLCIRAWNAARRGVTVAKLLLREDREGNVIVPEIE